MKCAACLQDGLRTFYSLDSVPVNSLLLLRDAEEARAFPTAPFQLDFCSECGFVANAAFDPAMTAYNGDYEETQGFSSRFRQFADELAQEWVDKYSLRGKHVVEVGCGKGEFLALMVEKGDNTATGFDPAYLPGRIAPELAEKIDFRVEFLDENTPGLKADAILCRHTLEHIPDVLGFMKMIRAAIGDQSPVILFEIPDVQRILAEVAFWDVFYEHCSYFSAGSLARLFRRAGFEVLDVRRVFDDQYLVIEARPSVEIADADAPAPVGVEDDLGRLAASVQSFESKLTDTVTGWKAKIAEVKSGGGKVAIWGSGSKSVAFLTTMGIVDDIQYIVDINPNKQGTYNAGTGQQIVAPEFLLEYKPELVIVMNAAYAKEITSHLGELGVVTEVAVL